MDPDIFKVTRISRSTQKASVNMLPRRQGCTYKYVQIPTSNYKVRHLEIPKTKSSAYFQGQ